ncbi:MAG: cellulose binding domain-containing protein, partial [Lachnospiraceae bacterium]|nr:cellulose binding domain-containing protein [Lachnospiraceae bacterium]
VSTAFTITIGVNYFLSRNNISFSAKCAEVKYIEYTDGETYKCKISKSNPSYKNNRFSYYINIEVENITEDAFGNWDVDIDFLQKVSLLESWNVSIESDDNTFAITPTDENKVIESGKVRNFGFLVSSKNEINIESIKISFNEL